MLKLAAMALSATLLASSGTAAQTLLDATNPDELVNLARGYGSASLDKTESGRPMIAGRIDGVPYYIYFLNCDDAGENCEDVNFYAGFLDVKPTMDAINTWNKENRFSRAYLDGDLDAVIEYDLNLEYGVSRQNLDANFGLWVVILEEYMKYIGFEP